jgi:hypothetical protein
MSDLTGFPCTKLAEMIGLAQENPVRSGLQPETVPTVTTADRPDEAMQLLAWLALFANERISAKECFGVYTTQEATSDAQ